MFVGSPTTGGKLEIDFGALRMVGGIITTDRIVAGDVNIKYKHVPIQANNKLHFMYKFIIFSFDTHVCLAFFILYLQVVVCHT